MEAMKQKQWEETEEVGVDLRGRLPHRQQSSTITTTASNDFIFSSESSASSEAESLNEEGAEAGKERPRNGTSDVSHKNGGTEYSDAISRFNGGQVDFLTSKKNPGDEIVYVKVESLGFQNSAATIHQDEGDMKGEEQNGHSTSLTNGTNEPGTVNLRESSEQEVSELLLERVYPKPASHDFYCPNCKSCITKVIIRGREWEDAAPPLVIDDPIRCTSCFSFLMPSGNWFFPKARDDEKIPTEQGTNIETTVKVGGASFSSPDLDATTQDQNIQTASLSNKSVGASLAAKAKSAKTNVRGSVGVEVPVPSPNWNETLYDKKPAMPAQTVGVGEDAPIERAPVPVEASFGVTEIAKPSGNTYESSVGDEPVPPLDSDGILHNQKPPVPDQSVEVSELGTLKYPASEINVRPQPEETDAAKPEILGSITVDIRPEPTTTPEPGDTKTIEILKSIVYGGLTETITSLGIVTSAASADTATLNILALALANLVGGLLIIGHNLWELKDDLSKVPSSETEEQVEKYQKVLGKRENFPIHASVAVLSFIGFGLVAPLVCGFSFRQSNNSDQKIAAVAVASLLCIIVLATGKAYIQRPQKYIKTLLYYITIGIGVGGVSYLAGDLIDKLIEKLGWFSTDVSGTLPLPQMDILKPALQFY